MFNGGSKTFPTFPKSRRGWKVWPFLWPWANANQYEQNYQLQYDYYKAGNTKIANNHTAVTTAVWWGLRSPTYNNYNRFVIVWTDAYTTNRTAYYSGGLRPGFAA